MPVLDHQSRLGLRESTLTHLAFPRSRSRGLGSSVALSERNPFTQEHRPCNSLGNPGLAKSCHRQSGVISNNIHEWFTVS